MNRVVQERLLGGLALALAGGLIATGLVRSHKVYDADTGEFGIRTYQKISDRQMIVDTTFGGVTRRGGKLLSTYDRSEKRGKRACPT